MNTDADLLFVETRLVRESFTVGAPPVQQVLLDIASSRRRRRAGLALTSIALVVMMAGVAARGAMPATTTVVASPSASAPPGSTAVAPIDGQVMAGWLPPGYTLRADTRVNSESPPSFERRLAFTRDGANVDSPGAGVLRIKTQTGAAESIPTPAWVVPADVPGSTLYYATGRGITTVWFKTSTSVVSVASESLTLDDLRRVAQELRLNIADCGGDPGKAECAPGAIAYPVDGGYGPSPGTPATTAPR